MTGCTKDTTVTLTVPVGRATVSEDVNLVERPLGATTDCSYAVTFPDEVKSLEINTDAAGHDTLIAKEGAGAVDADAQVTYRRIQIDVIVTMEFPKMKYSALMKKWSILSVPRLRAVAT